jgi:hypothetical protein
VAECVIKQASTSSLCKNEQLPQQLDVLSKGSILTAGEAQEGQAAWLQQFAQTLTST